MLTPHKCPVEVDGTLLWDVEVEGYPVVPIAAPDQERAAELGSEALGVRPFAEPVRVRPHGRVLLRG